MTTDYDYSEPLAIFADRDHPHRDFDVLEKVESMCDTKQEMAAAVGCTPPTLSKWLQRMRRERKQEGNEEEQCTHYEVCGNTVVGGRNQICDLCLDVVRRADHDGNDGSLEELYDEYSTVVNEFYERREKRQADEGAAGATA